jgi:hypothetical protein
VVGDSLVVETSTDWEQLELESLDNVLEYSEKDSIAKEKNLQTVMMKTYLHNTDLLSKRMVGARILEPHSSESELTWPKRFKLESNHLDVKDIPGIISRNDISVSKWSTNSKDILLTVSTKDISHSEKDMSVSTVSADDNDDILLGSTKDIFQSLTGYMKMGGGGVKRKLDDPGRWWLPSSWRAPWRRAWPSTRTTSEGRRGGWSRSTDPSRAEHLINEHYRNKQIWEKLKLELTDDMDREAGVSADGGGDQEDGEASGPIRGDRHDPVEAALGGADRDHEQEEGGVEDGQHAGQGQHHRGDGQGGHRGEGGEQLPRVFVRRKVRMRDGVSRDGRQQLSIVNYISKSGKGANSSTK